MFAELLRRKTTSFCSLSSEQVAALESHYHLLLRWNRVLNLTAIRDEAEIVERHYAESLFLGAGLPEGRLHIADVGSGAGFPGLPIAVLRPECTVTLIESHHRKAAFLREASREMPNVQVSARRAEEMSASFDWVVSRAVRRGDIPPIAPRFALLTSTPAGSDVRPLPWRPDRFACFT